MANLVGLVTQSTRVASKTASGYGGHVNGFQYFTPDAQAVVEAPGYLDRRTLPSNYTDGDLIIIYGNGFTQTYVGATDATTQALTLTQQSGMGAGSAGPSTFAGLSDTPANFIGAAGQMVVVNAGASALEFTAVPTFTDVTTNIVPDGMGGFTYTNETASAQVFKAFDQITLAGQLLYGTAADTVTPLNIGAAGQLLQVNAAGTAPEWASPAGLTETLPVSLIDAPGDIIYGTANDTATRLPSGAAGEVLTVSALGLPVWAAVPGSTTTQLVSDGTGGLTYTNSAGTLQTYDAFDMITSQGEMLYGAGSDAVSVLAPGAAGQVLTMNAAGNAPEWAASAGSTFLGLTDTPGVIDANEVVVGNAGGTALEMVPFANLETLSASAFTAVGQLLYGTAAGAFAQLTPGAAGQVLTMNVTATQPEWQTPSATATFIGQTDTPGSYAANTRVQVNAAGNALEFVNHYDEFTAAGQMIYAAGADVEAILNIGTPGQQLVVNVGGTAPEWQTITHSIVTATDTPAVIGAAGQLLQVNAGATGFEYASPGTFASDGAQGVTYTNEDATAVTVKIFEPINNAGEILYGTAADTVAALAIGTAGQALKVNAGATAPEWADEGNNRRHADNTTIAPASAGAPTLSEATVFAAAASFKNGLLYYTGDDLPASTPTYAWWIDTAGVATLLVSPASIAQPYSFATYTMTAGGDPGPVSPSGPFFNWQRVGDSEVTNIVENVTSGISSWTLKAGNRYKLMAQVRMNAGASLATLFGWYDATAGVEVGGEANPHSMSNGSAAGGTWMAVAIVEPTVDTEYYMREQGGSSGADFTPGGSWATIEQMPKSGA